MMRPINVFISSFVFFYCYFEFLGVFSGYEVKLFNSDLDFQDFIIIIIIIIFFWRNTILPSVQFLCFVSLIGSFLIFVCLSFFIFSLNGFVESLILDVYNIFKCQALNSSWFFSLFLRPQQNYDGIWNFGCSQKNIHGCRRIEMGTYTLFFLVDFAILQLP